MPGSALSTLLALLTLDDSDYLEGLKSSQDATGGFTSSLASIGGGIVVGGLAAAATAVTAVGIAAWDAGNTLDEAMDTISLATGATGEELATLQDDFKVVFQGVPTDAQAAADAIGILNARLGWSGPVLQNTSMSLLEMTRLLGGDLTANGEKFTRMVGDWGLNFEDLPEYMDEVFVAAQTTGANVSELMDNIVKYGAPMRNFGFSFAQAGGILAGFAAQGVNTEIVMSGLRVAQGKFINQGKDMNTGLWDTIDAIQNAEDSTKALGIANEVFGARAAGDMFDTIRSGKLEIGDLVDIMKNSSGAIMEASESTADWGEKWQKFRNQITIALAPVGSKMMEGVAAAMDAVIAIFNRPDVQAGINRFVEMIGQGITAAVEFIPVLIDGFFQFIDFLQNNNGVVIGILAALGLAATVWGITTAAAAITAIAPLLPVIAVLVAIGAAAYLVYQAWVNNWGGIRDIMSDLWENKLKPIFETVKIWLEENLPIAIQYLSDLWTNTLLPALTAVWEFLNTYIFPILGAIADVIGAVLSVAWEAFIGYIQNVTIPQLQTLWAFFNEKILPVIQEVAGWLGEHLGPAFEAIGEAIGGVVDWLHQFADSIRDLALPDWLTPGSPTPWELGLLGVNDALETLSRATLPRFQTSLQLQPVGAGALEVPATTLPEGGGAGASSQREAQNERLIREVLRVMRELPDTIKKTSRDDRVRRAG